MPMLPAVRSMPSIPSRVSRALEQKIRTKAMMPLRTFLDMMRPISERIMCEHVDALKLRTNKGDAARNF